MKAETTGNNPLRVLLVDDESLIRRAVRRTFASMPEVSIEDFELGAEAVSRAKEATFDVAVLDIQMPSMNGLEVARALREVAPGLRVVFVTANPESPLSMEAARFIGTDVISKPWATADLVGAITGRS